MSAFAFIKVDEEKEAGIIPRGKMNSLREKGVIVSISCCYLFIILFYCYLFVSSEIESVANQKHDDNAKVHAFPPTCANGHPRLEILM